MIKYATIYYIYIVRNRRESAIHAERQTSINNAEPTGDTEAIIVPDAKPYKGPSLSLMKVVVKHYGHILAMVSNNNRLF